MKIIRSVLFILMMTSCIVNAQGMSSSVSVTYSQQTIAFIAQPQSNGPALPLIQVKTNGGESYGIGFQSVDGGSVFIDILDASGKVLKAITVNDLLGKGGSDGVKLLSSVVAGSANRSENIYEVSSAQGKFHLMMSALATAATSTKESPAKLIVKIVLENAPAVVAGARIYLPFTGNAETKANGIILSGLKSAQPVYATIFPQSEKLSAAGKMISLTTKSVKVKGETILGMLTFDAANSTANASEQLQAAEKSKTNDVAIVTTTDKKSVQSTDTVTFHIICSNIGKGNVSDIVISNPVSKGTHYLEGSAVGDDTQITFDRAKVPAPQLGDVKVIKWKLLNSLQIGEERIVSFKVIVE